MWHANADVFAWGSEDNLLELVFFFFYHIGPRMKLR